MFKWIRYKLFGKPVLCEVQDADGNFLKYTRAYIK